VLTAEACELVRRHDSDVELDGPGEQAASRWAGHDQENVVGVMCREQASTTTNAQTVQSFPVAGSSQRPSIP
jgi:hypothetical protein